MKQYRIKAWVREDIKLDKLWLRCPPIWLLNYAHFAQKGKGLRPVEIIIRDRKKARGK